MKGDLYKALKDLPSFKERAGSVADSTLDVGIVQSESAAPTDRVEFTPLVVLPSNVGPGYYVEINEVKHYGATPLEALGQAVVNNAFGIFNINLP